MVKPSSFPIRFDLSTLLLLTVSVPCLVNLSACKSQASNPQAPMDFDTAMKKLRGDYAKGFRDFSIGFTSTSGKRLGEIPESETRLRVNGRGEATLFRRKGPGNSKDFPPGMYSGQIADSSMKAFLQVLERGQFQNLPRENHGPWDPVDRMEINTGKQAFSFTWGYSRKPMPDPMLKATLLLVDWSLNACPKPIWNLSLKVENLAYEKGRLSARLKVENSGEAPIHLLHPGSPGLDSEFGVRLEYGERQRIDEGYTPEPIEIKRAILKTPALTEPQLIEVGPKAAYVMEFSAALEGKAPRGWVGDFSFNHHLSADTLQGRPIFNGALSTEELEW